MLVIRLECAPVMLSDNNLRPGYTIKMSYYSEHFLSSFLQSTLPPLGLDSDTYGPYLLGLFPHEENDIIAEVDEDELRNILDLLQGSSETHADQNEAFVALGAELMQRNEQYWCEFKLKVDQAKKDSMRNQEERRRQEIEEAELVKRKTEEMKTATREETPEQLLKLRVIQQYAYDDSEQYDSDGKPIELTDNNDHDPEAGNLNRLGSELAMKERHAQMRNNSEQSKKSAREETAKQNMMKDQAKEERKKRATKVERKR